MINIKNASLIILLNCCILSCTTNNLIELPITEKSGYGPFITNFYMLTPYLNNEKNPWEKTYLKASGIPENWHNTQQGDISLNQYQSVYQNYLSGNITKDWYENLQRGWDWTPDTINLSKKPIKCKIAFAYGKDEFGVTKMVVDANNNLDFSDDKIFTVLEFEFKKLKGWQELDSLTAKNSFSVSYERLFNNKIIQETAPLFIAFLKDNNMLVGSFPQYATTRFKGEDIAVCSDKFISLSYKNSSIVLVIDSLKNGKKANDQSLIKNGEYLKIKNSLYLNKGVDRNKNVLVLEKVKESHTENIKSEPENVSRKELQSTQVGHKALPFEGEDFITKSKLTLDDYKGKFLLIDFWAVWCNPCIHELPNLKKIYKNYDNSKFEIVGIVGKSQPDTLKEKIDKHSITWPQILSDSTNKIIEKYGIQHYPTTILVNPEGVIVAKNLTGKNLEQTINELIK